MHVIIGALRTPYGETTKAMTCAGPFLSLSPRGSPIYIKHREKRRADKERVKILSGARHTRWPPANCRSRLCARELSLLANLRRHLMASQHFRNAFVCSKVHFLCVAFWMHGPLWQNGQARERETAARHFYFLSQPHFLSYTFRLLRRKWKEKYRWLNSYLAGEFNDQPCFSPIPPSSLLSLIYSLRILAALYICSAALFSLSRRELFNRTVPYTHIIRCFVFSVYGISLMCLTVHSWHLEKVSSGCEFLVHATQGLLLNVFSLKNDDPQFIQNNRMIIKPADYK